MDTAAVSVAPKQKGTPVGNARVSFPRIPFVHRRRLWRSRTIRRTLRAMDATAPYARIFRMPCAKTKKSDQIDRFFDGAKRDRTVDLLTASQALSQLSYSPIDSSFDMELNGIEPLTS